MREWPELQPLFQPDRPYHQDELAREAVVWLPHWQEVIGVLRDSFHRQLSMEPRRPYAVILGGRWFAVLPEDELARFKAAYEVDVWVDPIMERGHRWVLGPGPSYNAWVTKHCDAQSHLDDAQTIRELAARAPTDDAALAVLADWLEAKGDLAAAKALRDAQSGLQLLARLVQGT